MIALDRPNLIKMDCPLLAGLLAEEIAKRMPPGLDAVFFANSGADAVDSALKFARAAWTAAGAAQKGLFAQFVVMALMRDHHILTQVAGPDVNIIKFLPPLIIGEEEVTAIVSAIDQVMAEAMEVRGQVWGQSVELVKHALSR